MISRQNHIIQNVVLNLNCDREEKVYQLQNHYSDTIKNKVLPQLEEWLNTCIPDNEVIQLDRVDIDLGKLTNNISKDSLSANMFLELQKAIQAQLNSTNEKVIRTPIQQSKLNAIIEFLKTGVLATSSNTIQLEKELIALLNERSKDVVFKIQNAIQEKGKVVLQRLSLQFNEEALTLLFQKMPKGKIDAWIYELKELLLTQEKSLSTKQRIKIWNVLFELIFLEKKQISRQSILQLLDTEKIPLPKTVQIEAISILEKNLLLDLEEKKEAEEVKEETGNKGNSIYGNNVGIILLHPFLKTFFEANELLDKKGKFKSDLEKEKAIGLLHFLATGKREAKEFELSFQKIICGYPLQKPIASVYDISEKTNQEAERMLLAVIQYWDGLGKTSIDGLREGFIQREGKIQQNEETIQLQVERKTHDILLDKMPWNISMVKLPWLDKLIRVDWT